MACNAAIEGTRGTHKPLVSVFYSVHSVVLIKKSNGWTDVFVNLISLSFLHVTIRQLKSPVYL